LRKDLNAWHFYVDSEDSGHVLARFLIAFEELRARLAPTKYPNVEISDEGHLWFNIDTSTGIVEVLAFPFGFKEIKEPSIAVSLPRKAEDVDLNLLNRLGSISNEIAGVQFFGDKTASTRDEILSAFKRNEHPSLAFTSDFEEIIGLKEKGVFFSYLGVRFSVLSQTVSEVEQTIKEILANLERE